jgi:hypothetical protein
MTVRNETEGRPPQFKVLKPIIFRSVLFHFQVPGGS